MRANREKPAPLTPARSELSIPRSFYKIVHLCKKSHFLLRNLFLVNQNSSLGIEVCGSYVPMFSSFTIVSFCLTEFCVFFLISCLSDYFFRNTGGPTPPSLHPQLYEFYVSIKEVNRES